MLDGTTAFTAGVFMEVFFPVKVSRVGFFLNPSLDNVSMIALDTNFAFSMMLLAGLASLAAPRRRRA